MNISRGQSREYLTPGCPEDTRSEQSVCVVIVVVTPGCQDAAHNNPGDQPPAQTGDTLTHSHHSQGDTHLQPTPRRHHRPENKQVSNMDYIGVYVRK